MNFVLLPTPPPPPIMNNILAVIVVVESMEAWILSVAVEREMNWE
jgi:hypothetical protein